MIIEKCKIPKNVSFVLRSGVLDDALRAAGITTEASLHHVSGKIFFDAYFWPPRPNVSHERFYIRAGSVPVERARAARDFMDFHVVPDFIAWATGILALPPNSPVRRSEQVFARYFDGHAPGSEWFG